MTNDKDLKYTPKTYEQFILEEQSLEQKDLYPDLGYGDISSSKGYGPMETKTTSADNKGCSNPATFEVNTFTTGDYFMASWNGQVYSIAICTVASGKVKDQDFSGIQKRINDLKSGKLKVYKYKDSSRSLNSVERTEECIKFEAYFEASLENALKELKKGRHYGASYDFTFRRP